MYFSEQIEAFAIKAEQALSARFAEIDRISFLNTQKVMNAFREHRVNETLFNPTGIVNRAQMVTFLYSYMKQTGADMSVTGDLSAFTDAADVPDWAVAPMTWAVENGVISGVGDNTLAPAMNCNRAQMAVVLMAISK